MRKVPYFQAVELKIALQLYCNAINDRFQSVELNIALKNNLYCEKLYISKPTTKFHVI